MQVDKRDEDGNAVRWRMTAYTDDAELVEKVNRLKEEQHLTNMGALIHALREEIQMEMDE